MRKVPGEAGARRRARREGWYSLRAPRQAVASPALFRPPSQAASLTGGPRELPVPLAISRCARGRFGLKLLWPGPAPLSEKKSLANILSKWRFVEGHGVAKHA